MGDGTVMVKCHGERELVYADRMLNVASATVPRYLIAFVKREPRQAQEPQRTRIITFED